MLSIMFRRAFMSAHVDSTDIMMVMMMIDTGMGWTSSGLVRG